MNKIFWKVILLVLILMPFILPLACFLAPFVLVYMIYDRKLKHKEILAGAVAKKQQTNKPWWMNMSALKNNDGVSQNMA